MWLSGVKDCLSSTLVSLIWSVTGKEDLQLQLLDPCLICLFKLDSLSTKCSTLKMIFFFFNRFQLKLSGDTFSWHFLNVSPIGAFGKIIKYSLKKGESC